MALETAHPQGLIGRSRELDVATAALTESLRGRGRVLVLAGEPGIGKTRLADEITARAAAAGAWVSFGRCWEAGGAPVYWPWIEITRALFRAFPEVDGSAVAQLFGNARVHLAEGALEARFRLFDAVLECLRAAARDRPLVLVVDDAHVADEASMQLLQFVARGLRDVRLLLIVTVREPEVRSREAIAALVDAIAREGDRLMLQRFTRREIAEFVHAHVPLADDRVDALETATEGNPLCLKETVRWLSSNPAHPRHDGAAIAVPDGVRHAIAGNLERLDEGARELLAVAAVIGREIRHDIFFDVVARVHPAVSRHQLDELIREAARIGVLTGEATAFAFSHILVRESLYDRLSPARRALLHGHVAASLEARLETKLQTRQHENSETVTAIAHHYSRAGADGVRGSIAYGLRAARSALDALGAEEALTHFGRVLAHLDTMAPEPTLRSEALLGAAEARVATGDLNAARQLVSEVASLARALGDATLLARAALVLGGELRAGAIDGTLVSLLEEALERLPPGDSTLRARALGRLAAAMQPHVDTEVPVRMALDAVAMARRTDDRETLAYALHVARAAFMPRGHLAKRKALAEEALSLAEAIGDRGLARLSHLRLACDRLEDRNVERSLEHIDRLETLDASAPARQRWRAPLFRAMVATMQGDFAGADAFVARAKSFVDARDDNAATALIFHELGRLRTEHRHDDLTAAAARSDGGGGGQTFRSVQKVLINLFAATHAGNREGAAAAFAAFRSWKMPRGVAGLTGIAEAAALVATDEEVAWYYAELLDQADTIDVWGTFTFLTSGSTQRVLGILAARLRKFDDAFAHFARSVVDNTRVGAGPFIAETELAWAEALAARDGGGGPRLEARERIERARAIALALPLPGMLARISSARMKSSTVIETSSARGDANLRDAFVAEGDVWSVTWEDRTFRLKDARGLRLLVHLLERPDVEVHVLELAALVDGVADAPAQLGAGPALDTRAKAQYRARLEDLSAELREAESFSDRGRIERAQREIDAITEELANAVGLGGRDRATGSSAERARVRVQKRIADACKRIEAHAPGLARLLARRIRTGTFCSYRPRE